MHTISLTVLLINFKLFQPLFACLKCCITIHRCESVIPLQPSRGRTSKVQFSQTWGLYSPSSWQDDQPRLHPWLMGAGIQGWLLNKLTIISGDDRWQEFKHYLEVFWHQNTKLMLCILQHWMSVVNTDLWFVRDDVIFYGSASSAVWVYRPLMSSVLCCLRVIFAGS